MRDGLCCAWNRKEDRKENCTVANPHSSFHEFGLTIRGPPFSAARGQSFAQLQGTGAFRAGGHGAPGAPMLPRARPALRFLRDGAVGAVRALPQFSVLRRADAEVVLLGAV